MTTPIGKHFRFPLALWGCGVAFCAVLLDLYIVWIQHYPESLEGRWAIALIALTAYLCLCEGDLPTLGIKSPGEGWRQWTLWGVYLALVVGACLLVYAGVWTAVGRQLPLQVVAPQNVISSFLHMCVFAPLVEETIYRVILCAPLVPVVGPVWTIVIAGVVFGQLHVVYGNASPENQLGGFFLTWAYLRSGSIFIPVLLHSVGNFLVLMGQIALWYLL